MTQAGREAPLWVFGYGSLIWRPGFDYLDARPAAIDGWARRFWQGSHDHRGLPHAPGRVVTLVASPGAVCGGMAYLLEPEVVTRTFERLDHREKNGYQRFTVAMDIGGSERADGVVYIAPESNFAYLGEAPLDDIARQIASSHGPSGSNAEYLYELARALRSFGFDDDHVFELERLVLEIESR